MSHQTFKVCILLDDNVENFYIKHYIDEINPIFNRFKNQVFNRNPTINTPNLKIYWIDSEDDKILVSCEEDFRLYIEQGKGRKIYFSSKTGENQTQQNDEEPSIVVVSMESEDTEHRCDRRCRKGHKEEEKRRRSVKKLTDKLKHYEECVRNEDERHSRKSEKREHKNAERLERAKRRVEQIKSIIGSIDPANLNASFCNDNSTSAQPSQTQEAPSTSATNSNAQGSNETPNPEVFLSPETTRLLSNAIAGCLQPCTVINKVLNEVFALIPQMIPLPEEGQATASSTSTSTPVAPSSTPTTNTEQQTIEIPRQTTATNTSDANTPVPVRMANDEIEALFKEAAKELEKMNEIVKNSNKMETSTSTSSSMTGVTQIEKIYPNITDSCISDFFVTETNEKEKEEEKSQQDTTDSANIAVENEPTSKMGRSRESSIEVHDVGSIMSDDSRDWTMLSIDQEENVEQSTSGTPSRVMDPKTGAVPKGKSVDNASQVDVDEISSSESKRDSIKSVTAETQTQISIMSDIQQKQLQASVQKSIDIVKKSIQSIKKSADNFTTQDEDEANKSSIAQAAIPVEKTPSYGFNENVYPSLNTAASVENAPVVTNAAPVPVVQTAPELTQANIKATEAPRPIFAPAVIVYDPNPKINAAVHTMMQMGFSNEDNWLTQLLINVDGDIPKALNFLTPQPKNKKQ